MSELEKMAAVKEISQAQGEFLDWVLSRYTLCEVAHDLYWPVRASIQELLAEFHDIDLAKASQEQAEIMRKLQDD